MKRRVLVEIIKKALCVGCSVLFSSAQAFTLIASNPPRYASDTIGIRIVEGNCENINLNEQQLEDLVRKAVSQFWNRVPTSRLRFNTGPRVQVSMTASLGEMASAINEDEIVVGCIQNADVFEASNILAVATMLRTSSAKGVVAINDAPGAQFGTKSESEQVATIAHELGHAIGIGHSTHPFSLMYYAISPAIKQDALSQDDADAMTFLYPQKTEALGLLGACSSVEDLSNQNFWLNGMLSLLLLLAFYAFKGFYKSASGFHKFVNRRG